MTTTVISPEQFIVEINKLLPKQQGYRDGLEVFLVPLGANGQTATGYDFTHKDDLGCVGAVAAAKHELDKTYVSIPPLRA